MKNQNPLLVLRNIAKDYTGDGLFSDVNLSIGEDDRIAIVGLNGTGKSTLLKIIVGEEEEDEGGLVKNKKLKIGYLPQETHWKSLKNSILEEIDSFDLKKQSSDNYKHKGLVKQLLEKFGFPKEGWEREIQTLSGGEKTKLALAKVLANSPNLLVLDEPTNHLDLETIEWLENFLLREKIAIVCVSHDRYFLDKICSKTFEVTKDGLEKYYCKYSEYLIEKARRAGVQNKRYRQQERYLKQQQVFIDRFGATASKAKGVKNKMKQLDRIERIESVGTEREIKIDFTVDKKTCTKVLEINNLTIGAKGNYLLRINDKIEIDWGDKIGIIGSNGAGKSTFLKAILDNCSPEGVQVKHGQGIEIGYYAQAHENLDPEKSILEEVSSEFIMIGGDDSRNVLGRLLFTKNEVQKKISTLSGGERARVALAKLILQKPNLILLDEPTNHLDLPSKEVVTTIFKEYGGTLILISHDRYVLNEVCNHIWEIRDKKLKKYLGNYKDYRYHLKSRG